ncbi:hypothetical protein DdX_03584 [Ditylenchus destructor]|uniref:Uncharacterized protein n=1 Tax=Ditylenchus destructor TaxID=166010 RepID=A0AAD4NCS1_9BILA|nr:hypothetical protein DdX_03584 [Ditylenchus destructor]
MTHLLPGLFSQIKLQKLFFLIIVLLIFSTLVSSDDDRLWCYRGFKYHLGQEVLQDNQECPGSMLGLTKYCYRFVGEAAMQEVVKLGCASFICAGVRNHCAQMEFEGMKGTLCCCNNNNYCNRSSTNAHFSFISVTMFAILALIMSSLSWQVQ